MNITKEMVEKAKTAASPEELLTMAKAEGIELTAAEAETFHGFFSSGRELSDEELSQVAGGKSHESSKCGTAPSIPCFGSGFVFGLDACSEYYETADPDRQATAFTYPVLCYCKKGYFSAFPMDHRYDA